MRRWLAKGKLSRDVVEFLLGLGNLFILSVFTPIFFLAMSFMEIERLGRPPYGGIGASYVDLDGGWRADAPTSLRAGKILRQVLMVAFIIATLPAIAVVALVGRMASGFSIDVGELSMGTPRPLSVSFTLAMPEVPRLLRIPLACWFGLMGASLTIVSTVRKGMLVSPPTVGRIDAGPDLVDYGVFWLIGSTFVLGLSSAIYLLLATYAATRSERMVEACWRARYWYCLAVSLFGLAVKTGRWLW